MGLQLNNCHVCRHPLADQIDKWMKEDVGNTEISRRLQAVGKYISRITLNKHRRGHLMTPIVRERIEAVEEYKRKQRTIKGPKRADLLEMTRDLAVEGLQDGSLQVTLGDGLKADIALRQIAEKGADREWGLKMAAILGGGWTPQIVEGQYRELDAEAQEDFEAVALLTAG